MSGRKLEVNRKHIAIKRKQQMLSLYLFAFGLTCKICFYISYYLTYSINFCDYSLMFFDCSLNIYENPQFNKSTFSTPQ